MAPPPDTINRAFEQMRVAYVETLTGNAADALIAGEVRAMHKLRIPFNFRLVASRAVEATREYRQTLERFGGSDVITIGDDGIARREFKPWLNDMVKTDQERVGQIVQDAIREGTPRRDVVKMLDQVFTEREHNSSLTAFQETKQLLTKGTFNRYTDEGVQRGRWRHLNAQQDPREEHQDRDGQEYDLADPVWLELGLPNCHCDCEPVIPSSTSVGDE